LSQRLDPSAPLLKVRLENEIVRKRDAETRRTETAQSNDKYFNHWSIQNERYAKFDSFKPSSQLELVAVDAVAERRRALKELYRNDELKQQQQLIELERKKDEEKWELMKNKVASFRQCRAAKLSQLVEKNVHEQWKTCSDSYKAFESELKNQQLLEMWKKQQKLKEQERIQQAEEKETEKLILKGIAERNEQEEETERKLLLARKLNLKEDLEQQMELLRMKEAEEKKKKQEYEMLQAENVALEIAEQKLKTREEERLKKQQIGEFLSKQHLAKLRQRSREVAAELDSEKGFLECLFAEKNPTKTKEEVLMDMNHYLQLLQQHKQNEKERMKQTEFLFQEEARLVCEKMEREWEFERLARKRLIEDVVSCQKHQIESKIDEARRERQRLIQDREEIAQALEEYSQQLKTNQTQENERKLQTKCNLLAQVEMKRNLKSSADLQDREKCLKEKRLQDAFDEKHWALEMNRLKL